MIGRLIDGKYRILSSLGEGGMGAVFEAEHTGTGRHVALKVIAREGMLTPDFVGRFQREARAAGAIDTQHIVQVFDTGTDSASGTPFIVMELLAGTDLQKLLDSVRWLPVDLTLRIVFQACLGLAKAHQAAVIHRDIKPANLFLARRDAGEVVVKLLDFGVAKVLAESNGQRQIALTNPGGVLGSPAYMSPEQATARPNIDHRTDVWSMGVVLYEALSGVGPFEAASIGETLQRVCAMDAQPISQLVPGAPPGVSTILSRALARDPAQRFQSAQEMADAIRALLPQGWTLNEAMLEETSLNSMKTAEAASRPVSSRGRAPSQMELAQTEGSGSERRAQEAQKAELQDSCERLVEQTIANRYKLVRLLGKGGMGAVFEAVDRDGKQYALKVVLPDVALKSTDAVRRFVLEARAGIRLRGEFITQVVEAGNDEQKQLPFIVMELLRGTDLGRHVASAGPISPPIAARLFRQACLGLADAHQIGMIHRDIKPENIFLHQTEDGQIIPKLCDFGIAKQDTSLEELRATALTQTGSMLGSPMYMSPEQAENPKRADIRSDIWSMAISLYEALSGRPAWQGCSTVGELLLRLYTKEVPPLQDVAPWVESSLADVVHKALQRSPEARYQSASEFAEALAPLASSAPVLVNTSLTVTADHMQVVAPRRPSNSGARAVIGVTAEVPTDPRATSSRRPLTVAIGAVVLMLGAMGAFWYRTSASVSTSASGDALQTVKGSAAAAAQPPPPTAPPERGETMVSATVTIKPEDATVLVDGEPASQVGGVLRLERHPGSAVAIEVRKGDQRTEKMVVITSSGNAVPNEVALDLAGFAASAPHAPRPRGPSSSPATSHSGAAGAAGAAPAASIAPVSSAPRLKETW